MVYTTTDGQRIERVAGNGWCAGGKGGGGCSVKNGFIWIDEKYFCPYLIQTFLENFDRMTEDMSL